MWISPLPTKYVESRIGWQIQSNWRPTPQSQVQEEVIKLENLLFTQTVWEPWWQKKGRWGVGGGFRDGEAGPRWDDEWMPKSCMRTSSLHHLRTPHWRRRHPRKWCSKFDPFNFFHSYLVVFEKLVLFLPNLAANFLWARWISTYAGPCFVFSILWCCLIGNRP